MFPASEILLAEGASRILDAPGADRRPAVGQLLAAFMN